jgi:hypothetical protein
MVNLNGKQPRNHAEVDAVALGNGSQRLALCSTLQRFRALECRELGLAAELDAVPHRAYLALKLHATWPEIC